MLIGKKKGFHRGVKSNVSLLWVNVYDFGYDIKLKSVSELVRI